MLKDVIQGREKKQQGGKQGYHALKQGHASTLSGHLLSSISSARAQQLGASTASSSGSILGSLVPTDTLLRRRSSATQATVGSAQAAEVSRSSTEALAGENDPGITSGIKLSFAHNRTTAGGNMTIASGNVSQQGEGNISARTIYMQFCKFHAPPSDEHESALRYIKEQLQSYLVPEATLSKDTHDETSLCYPGTREKLLKQILSWVRFKSADNEDHVDVSKRAKCIVGAPGSGKSTIMNTLIIDLLHDATEQSPGLIAAHYSIRRSLRSTIDGSKVLLTLVYQLARRDFGVAKHVFQLLHQAPQTGVIPSHFREKLFLEAIKSYSNVIFVIIDALDEASHPRSLANTLSRVIPLSSSNLPLLLATRNEQGVLQGLGESLASTIVHEIPTEESIDDVCHYIHRRLKEGVKDIFGNNPAWNDWPDVSQVHSLSNRAGGLFIWARTAVDFILSRIERNGTTNRDCWIEDVGRVGMEDVSKLYMFILQTQLGDGFYGMDKEETGEENSNKVMIQQKMKGVLGFIIVAEHHLPLDDIVGLLDFKDFDVAHFVVLARSILVPGIEAITGSSTPTMHKTFVDFLTSKRASDFQITIEGQHYQAAKCCFALMETRLRFNIHGLGSSFANKHKAEDLTSKIPSGLLYASTHWWYHIQRGKGSLPPHLTSVRTLFFDQFLFWLEVVSLQEEGFKAARSCILGLVMQLRPSRSITRTNSRVLQLGQRLLRRSSTTTPKNGMDLASFAHEALVLMEKFETCILAGAPHIYVSLLAFSPPASIVATHYRNKVTTMVIPHPSTIPLTWDSWINDPRMAKNGRVRSISFSPCGRRLVAGYEYRVIRVWDVETGDCVLGPLKGHKGQVKSVCFSLSGSLIASGSDDQTIRVWDAETGQCVLKPFKGHERWVWSVAFSPDSTRIASASYDATIRVWDARTGICVLGPLEGHSGGVRAVSYSPDGLRIASCSDDGTIRLWDAQSGECVLGPRALWKGSRAGSCQSPSLQMDDILYPDSIRGVCFSSDGQYIATGSRDNSIRVWDAETIACIAGPIGGASGDIHAVAFSPNGEYVAAGSDDGAVRLWNFEGLLSGGQCAALGGNNAFSKAEITGYTVVDDNDWTLGPDGKRLFWAPKPYLSAIWRPSTARILGRPTIIKPDLSNLITGEEWLSCFPSL